MNGDCFDSVVACMQLLLLFFENIKEKLFILRCPCYSVIIHLSTE